MKTDITQNGKNIVYPHSHRDTGHGHFYYFFFSVETEIYEIVPLGYTCYKSQKWVKIDRVVVYLTWEESNVGAERYPDPLCMPNSTSSNISLSPFFPYRAVDIFQKAVVCSALYTEEVNLQTFVMI